MKIRDLFCDNLWDLSTKKRTEFLQPLVFPISKFVLTNSTPCGKISHLDRLFFGKCVHQSSLAGLESPMRWIPL